MLAYFGRHHRGFHPLLLLLLLVAQQLLSVVLLKLIKPLLADTLLRLQPLHLLGDLLQLQLRILLQQVLVLQRALSFVPLPRLFLVLCARLRIQLLLANAVGLGCLKKAALLEYYLLGLRLGRQNLPFVHVEVVEQCATR